MQADLGQVIVACGDLEIQQALENVGGHAVLTDPNHPSGSDRIAEALEIFDPDKKFNVIINLQGDLPTIDPDIIRKVLIPLQDKTVDLATLITKIKTVEERDNPDVVKAVVALKPDQTVGRALYFSRNPTPWGKGDYYHHIGIYAFRRDSLDRFMALPPGVLEQREKLEQLRALEAGMQIQAVLVDTNPLGVDSLQDLEQARFVLRP
jgi:3-deoxy-manno-octulosonate cytidylyltransferase (CMP-KDO synthetase)